MGTAADRVMNYATTGKKTWSKSQNGEIAPFYVANGGNYVNVYVNIDESCIAMLDNMCTVKGQSASCGARINYLENYEGMTWDQAYQQLQTECGTTCECSNSPSPQPGPDPQEAL